jgi:hypothetical protein
VDVLIFMSFYFELYIWPETILRWIRQRNSAKFCADVRKSVADTLAMIRQVFGEESMSCTQIVQTHRDQKREADEEQSQEHAHHFL